MKTKRMIRNFHDNDIYKFTMMQLVFHRFPRYIVAYEFINRGKTPFPKGFAKKLREQVDMLADLKLSRRGYKYLKSQNIFSADFLLYLKTFRLRPKDVRIKQNKRGDLKIKIIGPWVRTIWYEVPLLAVISQLYFEMMGQDADEKIFTEHLMQKAADFRRLGAKIIEFGTRRRYSLEIQERMIRYLKDTLGENFIGVSNVYLAMKYGLPLRGTMAHELFMALEIIIGLKRVNELVMYLWRQEFRDKLKIVLTDTFTTAYFLKNDFPKFWAEYFDGCRQDSGDPIKIGRLFVRHYKKLRIDPLTKKIVFSDSLDTDLVEKIIKEFTGLIQFLFGIGTFLTNDVGVNPLNIVIKIAAVKVRGKWKGAVKISDAPGKHCGEKKRVDKILKEINKN